jgi:DNA-directed RNA polymerase specialized sigma24 family protein
LFDDLQELLADEPGRRSQADIANGLAMTENAVKQAFHRLRKRYRELLREEIARTVSDAVSHLPEELRQAITLREMDGLSYEEIAETMDCPVGTVRSRIFRAREAIDARLRPLMDSERVRP